MSERAKKHWRERALQDVPEAVSYLDDFSVNRILEVTELMEHHPDFGGEGDYRAQVHFLRQSVAEAKMRA